MPEAAGVPPADLEPIHPPGVRNCVRLRGARSGFGATVLVVTSQALWEAAGRSEYGGYGAAQRVSITEVDDQLQVAFTNPVYMSRRCFPCWNTLG